MSKGSLLVHMADKNRERAFFLTSLDDGPPNHRSMGDGLFDLTATGMPSTFLRTSLANNTVYTFTSANSKEPCHAASWERPASIAP